MRESRSLILDLTPWTLVAMHSVRMPVGFGRGIKTRGRPICHGKPQKNYRGVDGNCLALALIIAIAKVDNDGNYISIVSVIRYLP